MDLPIKKRHLKLALPIIPFYIVAYAYMLLWVKLCQNSCICYSLRSRAVRKTKGTVFPNMDGPRLWITFFFSATRNIWPRVVRKTIAIGTVFLNTDGPTMVNNLFFIVFFFWNTQYLRKIRLSLGCNRGKKVKMKKKKKKNILSIAYYFFFLTTRLKS